MSSKDDGQGFDPASAFEKGDEEPCGWGLVGIQERVKLIGGEVEIRSEPGKGTHLLVRVPIGQMGGREHATYQTDSGG